MKDKQITILFALIFFAKCSSYDSCTSYFEPQMKTYCEHYFTNSTHKCYYSEGKCQLGLLGCSSYKGEVESECGATIPIENGNNALYKCKIVNKVCTEVQKECSDYEKGINSCESLSAGDSTKRCILNNGKCEAHYDNCDFNGATQQTCAVNIPSDPTKECVWESDKCQEKTRKCEGIELSGDEYCLKLTVTDSDNKICVKYDDKCKEQYKTCELYNQKASNKNKEECESIKFFDEEFDYVYKCVFKDNVCSTRTKCSDFTDKSGCKDFTPTDPNKKCYFDNGVCKEIYKSCELYNAKTSSENKNEADCKATKEYNEYGNIDYSYICVFDKDKTCKKQKLTKCEDYESWMDERHCYNMYNNYKHCTFENKKCVEEYNNCPGTNEEISKEKCEAIKLWDYYICKYDETNKNCYIKIGECSDGTNEEKCKKIVPYDKSNYRVDYKNKCVWESQSCVIKTKVCGDAKDFYECSQITPATANKNCAYINGECKEQYKDCSTYNSESNIEKTVCESIFVGELYKCVFKSGTPDQCVQESKYSSCTDFKKDEYKSLCTNYDFSTTKKCTYSNSACSTVQKTCLELSNESKVSDKTCENAPTSGYNKYCVLKEDESGCEEKERENNDNKGAFGLSEKKLWFNLLVILFWLLL